MPWLALVCEVIEAIPGRAATARDLTPTGVPARQVLTPNEEGAGFRRPLPNLFDSRRDTAQ